MNLRHQLLLPQIPLFLALALIAGAALYAAFRFGAAPGEILHENFRSFDAGRSMLAALETLDRAPLASAEEIEAATAAFERELRLQESNVTETGEAEATRELRAAWLRYRQSLASPLPTTSETGAAPPASEISDQLRATIDHILELNRDAMRRKSREAKTEAERLGAGLTAAALGAFLLAVVVSGIWLRRVLAPVRVLERAVESFTAGDFDTRIRVQGDDEIASLSRSFNEMGEHLSRYRQSSLGELLEANNRLESVMDSLAEAVVVYDLAGSPVAWNRTALRLLGDDRLELAALPEALHDAVVDAFERVRQSGEAHDPPSLEAAVELAATPAPRWILVGATPVRTRTDALTGITVALRDVTRARRIEGFRGDLVAAAAHELRTPLTSLHLAIHLCLEGAAGPLTDRQTDLLSAAREDCQRLQTVLEELLEMARLESGTARLSRSSLTAADLVRETAARHEARARELGKRVTGLPGDALLRVDADLARLRHVFDNLVENALLHSDTGHQVTIGCEEVGTSVRFFIDDDGPGVPDEFRRQVFAKFFRAPGTLRPGSGLGLSIVEDIVRAHGGEVGVGDAPLGGARFWFTLPAAPRDHSEGFASSPVS